VWYVCVSTVARIVPELPASSWLVPVASSELQMRTVKGKERRSEGTHHRGGLAVSDGWHMCTCDVAIGRTRGVVERLGGQLLKEALSGD
jgi:hypothetical protein